MKLLTLNTHSLHGEDTEETLRSIRRLCFAVRPDVIALQEVNQSRSASLYQGALPKGYRFCQDRVFLREDHFGIRLLEQLLEAGLFYYWSWLPVKMGYDRFDEGLLTLSRFPISEARAVCLSEGRSYEDWRRRMALLIRPEGEQTWFVNLHMSWWRDEQEPFLPQWNRLMAALPGRGTIWLMGDFNNPADLRGEGYDRILSDGFFDCYHLARLRDGAETVRGPIDGWHRGVGASQTLRIDQIWCNRPLSVASYRVVLDGRKTPVVSDHFGVLVETE